MLGSGSIIVADDSVSIPALALRTARFYHHESCGKCTPCREGTNWTVKMLERVVRGEATPMDLDIIASVQENIIGHCLCVLGDSMAMPVGSMVQRGAASSRRRSTSRQRPVGSGRRRGRQVEPAGDGAPSAGGVSRRTSQARSRSSSTASRSRRRGRRCWSTPPSTATSRSRSSATSRSSAIRSAPAGCAWSRSRGSRSCRPPARRRSATAWSSTRRTTASRRPRTRSSSSCSSTTRSTARSATRAASARSRTSRWAGARARSRVTDPKRHFQKPIPLSPLIKIDRERCILCYRCVRFSQEVAEDEQLQLLERGASTLRRHVRRPPLHRAVPRQHHRALPRRRADLARHTASGPGPGTSRMRARSAPSARASATSSSPSATSASSGCSPATTPRSTTAGSATRAASATRWPSPATGSPSPWSASAASSDRRAGRRRSRLRRPGCATPASARPAIVGGRRSNEEGYLAQRIARRALRSPHVESRPAGGSGIESRRTGDREPGGVIRRGLVELSRPELGGEHRRSRPRRVDPRARHRPAALDADPRPADPKGGAPRGRPAGRRHGPPERPRRRRRGDGALRARIRGRLRRRDGGAGLGADGYERASGRAGRRRRAHRGDAEARLDGDRVGRSGCASARSTARGPSPRGGWGGADRGPGRCQRARPARGRLPSGRRARGYRETDQGLDASGDPRRASQDGSLDGRLPGERRPGSRLRRRAGWGEALGKAKFVLSVSMFEDASTRHADVVFPAESYAEKEGTVTHPDGRLQRLRPGTRPRATCEPSWEVLAELSALLGDETGIDSAPDALAAIASEVPFYAGHHARGDRRNGGPLAGARSGADILRKPRSGAAASRRRAGRAGADRRRPDSVRSRGRRRSSGGAGSARHIPRSLGGRGDRSQPRPEVPRPQAGARGRARGC